MNKIKLNLLCCFFIICSCSSINDAYFIKTTNIDTQKKIKNNGYFYSEFKEDSKKHQSNYIKPYILYSNGTVLSFDHSGKSLSEATYNQIKKQGLYVCLLKPKSDYEDILKYFECTIENKLYYKTTSSVYQIFNDTIKIQTYTSNNSLLEKSGIVLNDSAFVLKKEYNYKKDKIKTINERYKFRAFDKKPPINTITNTFPRK
tara:strand:- start:1611 stop:2216 length:606 start_codon:yes stop_codon:yes gene_type:complete